MTSTEIMKNRPKIAEVCFYSAEGNPQQFVVGRNCTEIRETQEEAEVCYVPWLEVYADDRLVARFNQHKVEHIFYQRS